MNRLDLTIAAEGLSDFNARAIAADLRKPEKGIHTQVVKINSHQYGVRVVADDNEENRDSIGRYLPMEHRPIH